MKLAFIVPIDYISKVDKYCDFHLFLSHLFIHHEYLKEIRKVRIYKILDNGAFENGIPEEGKVLLNKAKFIKAQEIVCPDVFYNYKETLKKVKEWITFLKKQKELNNYRLMACIQGTNFNELVTCYINYLDIPEIEVIGIGYTAIKTAQLSEDLMWNRIKFIHKLQDADLLIRPIHLLGLADNGGIELQEFSKTTAIRSNDSSAAYVVSKDKTKINSDGTYNRKSKIDFTDTFNRKTFSFLQSNIKTLKNLSQ